MATSPLFFLIFRQKISTMKAGKGAFLSFRKLEKSIMATEKKGCWLTLGGIILVLGIVIFLLLLLWKSFSNALCLADCVSCQRNLSLALLNYTSENGQFPPAYVTDDKGKPLYSWRVLILPYIDEEKLWENFHRDEPWNSSHNIKLTETNIPIFRCLTCYNEKSSKTNHVLVTGPGTIWEDGKACSMDDISYPSQTLMLIEVADTGTHWAEPFDLNIDDIDPRFLDEEGNFKTNHPGYVVVTFADGHTMPMPQEEIMTALKEMSQIKQEPKENFKY